jgi:hypothetical protein
MPFFSKKQGLSVCRQICSEKYCFFADLKNPKEALDWMNPWTNFS